MPALRRLAAAAFGCFAIAAAGASPALAGVECVGVQNCTTVTGPWVALPVPKAPQQYAGVWGANCDGGAARGSDWNASGSAFDIEVYIEQISRTRLYVQSVGLAFLAANPTRSPQSFQPLVGCEQFGGTRATAAGAPGTVRRIATRRLRPARTARFTHGCRRGERLTNAGTGVGFHERRPPSARELRQVDVRHVRRRGKVRARVETGPRVGDDERVELQIHAVCRP